MSLPADPYQSPEEPFMAAVHNAGHALGCIATGRTFPSILTAQVCRGNPLGLKRGPDRFSWAVICWTGPAAEAVAANRSGTRKRDAAHWIWALYQAAYSGAVATGDYPGAAATDPAVVAVALAVADANWTGIERIASALTGAAGSRGPVPGMGPEQVMALVRSRDGADIGPAFDTWQRAIAKVKDRQGAGLRWP
jgi:hypothetical protein